VYYFLNPLNWERSALCSKGKSSLNGERIFVCAYCRDETHSNPRSS
jgi:hypothetical protein